MINPIAIVVRINDMPKETDNPTLSKTNPIETAIPSCCPLIFRKTRSNVKLMTTPNRIDPPISTTGTIKMSSKDVESTPVNLFSTMPELKLNKSKIICYTTLVELLVTILYLKGLI